METVARPSYLTASAEMNVSRIVEAMLMAHRIEHNADIVEAVTRSVLNGRKFGDDDNTAVHYLIQMISSFAVGDRDFINILNCAARIRHATKLGE